MAERSVTDPSGTSTIQEIEKKQEEVVPTLKLRLKKPPARRVVQWEEGTIDNEFMNKKKSKCCCIYKKPRMFGESSSEDSDDDCDHCHDHKPKDYRSKPQEGASEGTGGADDGSQASAS